MATIKKRTVGELLHSNLTFKIPREYQRGYRWHPREVEQLLEDVLESNDEGGYSLQPLAAIKDGDNVYQIIDGQQRLTTIMLILQKLELDLEEPTIPDEFNHNEIDSLLYVREAWSKICEFVNKCTNEERTQFKEKLNRAFFLCYQVDKNEEDPKEIYIRLNDGKIALSSAELLKAWIFTYTDSEAIRRKWNDMEMKLEDSLFFGFINPDHGSPRYFATKIDYIVELAELALKTSTDMPADSFEKYVKTEWEKNNQYAFFSLYNTFNKREEGNPIQVFEKIVQIFNRLYSYYGDIDLYNSIGFLLHCKNERWDRYKLLLDKSLIENIERTLPKYVREKIGDPKTVFTNLKYPRQNNQIHNVLLLYNLTFYRNGQNSWFDFGHYDEEAWTLDHICARNEEVLNDFSALEEEVKSTLDSNIIEELKNQDRFKDKWAYQSTLYDLRDGFKEYKNGELIDTELAAEGFDWINDIGNLVLLQHNLNSYFNNKGFQTKASAAKKSEIKAQLYRGTFDTYDTGGKFWTNKECRLYQKKLIEAIEDYLAISYTRPFLPSLSFEKGTAPIYGGSSQKTNLSGAKSYNLNEILGNTRIEIPDFQRDYAQGRPDDRAKFVREMFLASIFEVLEKDKSLNLDFIYGRVNGNKLYPFDGQQRLTTLFLVYSALNKRCAKKNPNLCKFTYSNRPDASQFVEKCAKGEDVSVFKSTNPSVKGMAVTLGEIEAGLERITKQIPVEELLRRADNIKFYIPENVSMEPDIYWRMNARGRRLTPLERFKASFFDSETDTGALDLDKCAELFFKAYYDEYKKNEANLEIQRGTLSKEEYSNKHRENEQNLKQYESALMYLISIMFDSFRLISNPSKKEDAGYDSTDFFKPEITPSSSYKKYKDEYGNIIRELIHGISEVNYFPDFLELIGLSPEYIFNSKQGEHNLKVMIEGRAPTTGEFRSQNYKSLIFAYLLIVQYKLPKKEIAQWLRVAANLIWNTGTSSSALKIIRLLAENAYGSSSSKSIIHFLRSVEYNSEWDNGSYKQEIIKARYMDIPEWMDLIIEAESSAFSDGDISFLYEVGDGWNPEGFGKRLENYKTFFNRNGVNELFAVDIIKSHIKASKTARWGHRFFDTTKTYWKETIMGGAVNQKDSSLKASYKTIVEEILSCNKLEDIKFQKGEDDYTTAIKASLLKNEWFLKWMHASNKGGFNIEWKVGYEPVFHEKNGTLYIIWDLSLEDNAGTLNTYCFHNEFFRTFRRIKDIEVVLNPYYYRLIDCDGLKIEGRNPYKDYTGDDNFNLVVLINPWRSCGLVRFEYKKGGKEYTMYLSALGYILIDEYEDPSVSCWNGEEYKKRWIYSDQNIRKSNEEILKVLDGIAEEIRTKA